MTTVTKTLTATDDLSWRDTCINLLIDPSLPTTVHPASTLLHLNKQSKTERSHAPDDNRGYDKEKFDFQALSTF